MQRKMNKKGFTIVELVIVIVVIAILAAVLIPTFVSLVKKANLSADQQAVRQMNTVLSMYDADGSVKNVADAIAVLDKENIELENYKALTKDHYFFFVLDKNGNGRIILADKDKNIVYPEDIELLENTQWMSLSGMVPMSDDYTIDENGSVAIDNGAEFVHLMDAVLNNEKTVSKITLSGTVDLMGAAVNFGEVDENISIVGVEGTLLTGLRADDCSYTQDGGEFAGVSYGYALFGVIEEGVTVEIKNVTISNMIVGNTLTTHDDGANSAGLIAGRVEEDATLKLENVTIKDCALNGYQKVGAIVGYNANGTVELKNVDVINTQVNGYLETAKVVGYCNGTLTADADCDFSGITMSSTVADEKQIGHSDFTVTAADGTPTALVGASDNIFLVGPYGNIQYLWASVTNDWAWYIIPGEKANRPTVTVEGFDSVTLNGATYSASANFANGVPQS